MFQIISNILSILNSNKKPEEICLGVVLGIFAGFFAIAPFNFVFVFLLIVLLNVNSGMFALSTVFFKLLAFLIDPVGDKLGYGVLTADFLVPLWKWLSALPIIPYTRFNNTVVIGDFLIGVIITPLAWMGTRSFIVFYRKNWQEKLQKLKIMQILSVGQFIEKRGKK